jgi:AcrR family transcriptional regulator
MAALRADAQRSIERILDAAVEELGRDPEASMAAVARRAGVVRATVYVHFPTREALVDAVTDRALGQAADAIRAAEPERGDPYDAMRRVLAAAWQVLARHHAMVGITTRKESEEVRALHGPVLGLLADLLRRGQADGSFDDALPVEWLLTVILELVHAASREVTAGRMTDEEAERALLATLTGALAARAPRAPASRS